MRNQKHRLSEQEQAFQLAIAQSLAEIKRNPEAGLSVARRLSRRREAYRCIRQQAIHNEHQKVRLAIICHEGHSDPNLHQLASRGSIEEAVVNELVIPEAPDNVVEWAMQAIGNSPADCVILQARSMPMVLAGLLYKLIWGSAVLVHDESVEEKSQNTSLTINEIKTQLGRLPAADNLRTTPWTRLAEDCCKRFDGETRSMKAKRWREIALAPLLPVDGAQLNSLEAIAPELSSPLMAARFCERNDTRINWSALRKMRRREQCVSIVIPVYGNATETDNCLRSVREAKTDLQWEVIAVMNDESPGNCEVVNKHTTEERRIRTVWPGENLQFALGCNLGFSVSTGEWLVVLNNDCQVKDSWLDELIAPLQDPRIAATQPRLIKPDGSVQSLGVVFNQSQTLGYPLYAGLKSTWECTLRKHELQALTGACLAVRAKDYAQIRGFDCRYINSQEDIDFCLRLMQLPEREACLSIAAADVLHGESRSPGRFSHSQWSRHQFVRRWANRIKSDDEKVYLEDDMTIKCFTSDHPSLEHAGIGAGRAQVEPIR